MKLFWTVGIFLLSIALCPSLQAEEKDFGRPGWFLGAGLTVAGNLFAGAIETVTIDKITIDPVVGFNVRGGYRFNRWVAAEIQLERPGTFQSEGTTQALMELTSTVVTLSAKLYPIKARFQPYFLFRYRSNLSRL